MFVAFMQKRPSHAHFLVFNDFNSPVLKRGCATLEEWKKQLVTSVIDFKFLVAHTFLLMVKENCLHNNEIPHFKLNKRSNNFLFFKYAYTGNKFMHVYNGRIHTAVQRNFKYYWTFYCFNSKIVNN